jgi:arylsulfatase A-like enzyme
MDLLAQRPSAVIVRDGRVVVDLGRENARKHLALGPGNPWRLAQEVDGVEGAVLLGRSGSLDIPLDGELAPAANPETPEHAGLALAITLRSLAPRQSMTVLWEERPIAHLRIGDGWARRTISLPADLVRPGENRLRLHFRRTVQFGDDEAAAVVSHVEVGTHAAIRAPDPPALDVPYRVHSRAPGDIELALAPGVGLAYYVTVPRRGRIELDVRGRGSLEVLLSLDADHERGAAPRQLLQEPLTPTGRVREVDLSAWGGAPVRLEMRVKGSGEGAGAMFSSARIIARRSLAVDRRKRGPADVVVLAVEGARADELLDVSRRPPLPNFESFAREALVFERAHAAGAAAVPSHAALLSSVPPPVHLTIAGTFVAESQTMLAEVLDRAGYFSVLASANSYVNEERGLLQGFDDLLIQPRGSADDARALVDRAMEKLEGRPGHHFLYAVLNDPQAPFDPPRELFTRADAPPGAPLPHHTHVWVGRVRMGRIVPEPAEVEYVRQLYRGEFFAIDEALGSIVEALREAGRLDDTIIVLVGLHGEEFLEHGSAGHGHTLYQESVHVPLAIRAPKLLAPGRVRAPVDLLDLVPTLADLLALPYPDGWQGESLVSLIDDPHPPPRLVVAYLGDGSRAGLVGEHKLILGPGHTQRFFDLATDPLESEDRIANGGVALRIVRSALAWHLWHAESWRRARWGTGANLRPAFAQDLGM